MHACRVFRFLYRTRGRCPFLCVFHVAYNLTISLFSLQIGKGTQCQLLTERLTTTNNKNNNIIDDDTVEVTNNSNTTNNQWVHLSAGDLLRAERSRADSVLALEINACIAAGQLVASTVTCQLLTNAMRDAKAQAVGTVTRIHFLIDGFPRSQSNIEAWNATVNPNQYPVVAVLNYVCPEETLIGRLLERGKSSGRADDNLTSVKARFETFAKETAPLLEFYQNQQHHIPVYTIATDKPVEAVYQDTVQYFQ